MMKKAAGEQGTTRKAGSESTALYRACSGHPPTTQMRTHTSTCGVYCELVGGAYSESSRCCSVAFSVAS